MFENTTDAEGRFELRLGTGTYRAFGLENDGGELFTISDTQDRELQFHSNRPNAGPLKGRVVTGNPARGVRRPILAVEYIASFVGNSWRHVDEEGRFELTRQLAPMALYGWNSDRSLAGFMRIDTDDGEAELKLAPSAPLVARILKTDGQPVAAESEILFGARPSRDERPIFLSDGGSAKTNAEGRVTFTGLVVGAKYEIVLRTANGVSPLTTCTPETADEIDLGDLSEKLGTPDQKAKIRLGTEQ